MTGQLVMAASNWWRCMARVLRWAWRHPGYCVFQLAFITSYVLLFRFRHQGDLGAILFIVGWLYGGALNVIVSAHWLNTFEVVKYRKDRNK